MRRSAVVVVILGVALGLSCRRSGGAEGPKPSSGGVATPAAGTVGVPRAAEMDEYVTGAGSVHLGMTEDEVSDALDSQPTRRGDDPAPGSPRDVAWGTIGGARPGAAVGLFQDGRLVRIEFAPAGKPEFPRVDRAAADSLTSSEYVQRSVAHTLRLSDIEAVTRTPGYRATWSIGRRSDGKTVVVSRWMWEVEPGKILYVPENDGDVGQPVIRSVR